MKVLYLSAHPHLRTDAPSGYATHMRETMAALRAEGCEVVPLIAGDAGPPPAPGAGAPAPGGLRGLARRLTPGPVWQALRDLALGRHDRRYESVVSAALARERPDVVYERAAYLCAAGVRAAGRAGVPLVLEVNAPYVEERRALHGPGLLDGRGRRWEQEVLLASSLVVTVSTVLAERLREAAGLPGDAVRVLPNAVDPAAFGPATPSRRQALGFAPDDFVLGFVGTFFAWHRLESVVAAVAALRREGVPAKALLIGDGEARGDLEAAAAAAGVAEHVVCTGSLPFPEVPAHVQSADVCVVPGHAWYCSPLKLFEYGGLGKPVIALDSAPIREVTDDGADVVLVDGSPEALLAAARDLHRDADRRAALGRALHERVLAHHTWTRTGERLTDWMQALARSRDTRNQPN